MVKEIKSIVGKNVNYEIVKYPSTYPADEPSRRLPDLTKAKDHLKYEPRISLREGLRRFLEWSDKTILADCNFPELKFALIGAGKWVLITQQLSEILVILSL